MHMCAHARSHMRTGNTPPTSSTNCTADHRWPKKAVQNDSKRLRNPARDNLSDVDGVSYTLTHTRTENVLRKRMLEWNCDLLSCSPASLSAALYQFPDKHTELSLSRSYLLNEAADWQRCPAGGSASGQEQQSRLRAWGSPGTPGCLPWADLGTYRPCSRPQPSIAPFPPKRPGGARRTQQGMDVLSEETAGHRRGTQVARLGVSLPWEETLASRLRHSPG